MRRGQLTREAIILAAADIADAEGLDAVSMRNVAAKLGVRAMSLYNHVANKAALIDGLHEHLMLQLDLDLGRLGWKRSLRSVAAAYRALALAHPSSFVLLTTRPLSTPAEVAHAVPLLDALARAGFAPAAQLRIVNFFFAGLNGYLLAEVAPVPGQADVSEPDPTVLGALPNKKLTKHLAKSVVSGKHLTYHADHYDAYVETLIAGLAATLKDAGASK